MRAGEGVFVDTGAWLALALLRDPHHERAASAWEELLAGGAHLHTSVPVILETFTFLERNVSRDLALAWKDSLGEVRRLRVLDLRSPQLPQVWSWFRRRDLHKLSAVDAASFVVMTEAKLRLAFTFDQHFAAAGFRTIG